MAAPSGDVMVVMGPPAMMQNITPAMSPMSAPPAGGDNVPVFRDFFQGVDCFNPFMIITNGIWLGDNPLSYALPLFLIQLLMVSITSRILAAILKPLRQPMVLAEILAGMLLGPSGISGYYPVFRDLFFPARSINIMSSIASLALIYFVFMVAVEIDMMVLKQQGKKVLLLGIASIALPFAVTITAAYLLRHSFKEDTANNAFYIYIGIALSVTAFPVLARVLNELKLLSSDVGRLSLAASVVNDLFSWVLLAICMSLSAAPVAPSGAEQDFTDVPPPAPPHYVLLSGLAFVLVCLFVVHPLLAWLVRKTPEGEPMSDMHLGIILMGVIASGFLTDFIGIHSIFGAFIYGLAMPAGPHGTALVERLEDFVTGLLLPLYFASSGFRTVLSTIKNFHHVFVLVFVFVLSSIAKIVGTILIALYYDMPLNEGLSLGFLMNTRGLVEVIILNVARDKDILSPETFAVMVVMSVVLTAMVTPVVSMAYKPSRRLGGYKRRNLMRCRPDMELRMVACVHTGRNVPSIVSLLDISNPTKRSPIFVYAIHLIELTGRASAMLIVHNTGGKARGATGGRAAAQSEHIISAFETYEQHAGGVSVQPITAISPYDSMHDDIVSVAEDKRAALIVIPFHKLQTVDGGMEAANPAIRSVNQNVLKDAPCSVAILVDRGLSAAAGKAAGRHGQTHHIAALFFGGADDREALAYAWRMAEHPNVSLTVVRFIPGEDATAVPATPLPTSSSSESNEMLQSSRIVNVSALEGEKDRAVDDEFVSEFRLKNLSDESIVYTERVVSNSEETVAAIRGIDSIHDLYMVGRTQGAVAAAVTAGMTEWTECEELGPIGDLLASMDFGATVSVLVIQQYVGVLGNEEGAAAAGMTIPAKEAESEPVRQYVSRANHRGRNGGRTGASFNGGWNAGP